MSKSPAERPPWPKTDNPGINWMMDELAKSVRNGEWRKE